MALSAPKRIWLVAAGWLLWVGGCDVLAGYNRDYELAVDSSLEDDAAAVADRGAEPGPDRAVQDATAGPDADAMRLDAISEEAPVRDEDAGPDSGDGGVDADSAVAVGVPCGPEICKAPMGCCSGNPTVPDMCTSAPNCLGPMSTFSACDGPEDCALGGTCCAIAGPLGTTLLCRLDTACPVGGTACHMGTASCNCKLAAPPCEHVTTCDGRCM
jgi:hypothetical protein